MYKPIFSIIISYFVVGFSFGNPLFLFCSGELADPWDPNRFDEDYGREFVLPDGGLMFQYSTTSSHPIPSEEKQALSYFHKLPASVLYVQLSTAEGASSLRYVEGLCVDIREGIENANIDPTYHTTLNENAIRWLSKLPRLKHLELYDFEIGTNQDIVSPLSSFKQLVYLGMPFDSRDEHLQNLSGMTNLEFLNLSGTQITGQGLTRIETFPKLKTLDLRHTNLKRGVLSNLRNSKTLLTLLLAESSIQNEDLVSLGDFSSLQYLTVHRTSITDDVLSFIARCKNLRYLSVYDTKISNEGVNGLTKLLPHLFICREPPLSTLELRRRNNILLASMGDCEDQCMLGNLYNDKDEPLYVPNDLVESLKWYLIASNQGNSSQCRYASKELEERIAKIKSQLSPARISDARQRAEALLFLQKNTRYEILLKREEGLPTYQYAFEK